MILPSSLFAMHQLGLNYLNCTILLENVGKKCMNTEDTYLLCVQSLRKIPIFLSQIWGVLLLRLTRSYPKIENMDKLKDFYKQ